MCNSRCDVRLETMLTFPVIHGASLSEMLRQMFDAFLPSLHTDTADAASRLYRWALDFPRVYYWQCLDVVNKSEMLDEMVLAAKGRRLFAILTTFVIVSLEMLRRRVELTAVCAVASSCI